MSDDQPHENPVDQDDVTDTERAEMLESYIRSLQATFDATPKFMPLDDEGKAPIIKGRCSLDSDDARDQLLPAGPAIRAMVDGARGFALYAGRDEHDTGNIAFVDHDSDEFEAPTGEPTLEVLSGSGRGVHETYRNDSDDPVRNARVGDGLGEVRAENWYVVVPGSIHPSGGVYHVTEDREIATISDAELEDNMRPAGADESTGDLDEVFDDSDDWSTGNNGGNDTDGTGDAEAVAEANPWIMTYLTFGTEDRSDMDHAVCRELVDNDVSEDDAHALLNDSRHTKVHDRGQKYWQRTWSNACEQAADGGVSGATPQGESGADGAADDDWVDKARPYVQQAKNDTRSRTVKDARAWASSHAMDAYDFLTPEADGEKLNKYTLWSYYEPDGCYERRGAAQIAEDLSGSITGLSTGDQDEIANLVKRQTMTSRDQLDAEREDHLLINLENCVFDVDAGETLDHSPDYNFRHVHPFDYDPDASAKPVLNFLEDVVEHDYEVQTLLEYIGYCFEDGYPLPQFLLLHGTGGNGKGIFFDIVEALIGSSNTSSVGLNDMMGERNFMLSELDGSFANIDGDIAGGTISTEELHVIKKLTGRDPIEVERKFEHPFTLRNRAKLMFAANKPPRIHDSTNSVARRLMAIEFPYEFVDNPGPDQKQRRPYGELMDELTSDDALSGLFNEAIEAYQTVRETGQFTIEEQGSNKERLDAYQRTADPIVAFAHRCIANERHYAIPKDAVYAAYTGYAQDNGEYPADVRVFFEKLQQATDIDILESRPRINTSTGERRPRICDDLWLRKPALDYLSKSAREKTRLVMANVHPTNADYAEDFLGLVPEQDDGDGEGLVRDTQRIVDIVKEYGEIDTVDLEIEAAERHEMDVERLSDCVSRALERGDIMARQDDHLEAV